MVMRRNCRIQLTRSRLLDVVYCAFGNYLPNIDVLDAAGCLQSDHNYTSLSHRGTINQSLSLAMHEISHNNAFYRNYFLGGIFGKFISLPIETLASIAFKYH